MVNAVGSKPSLSDGEVPSKPMLEFQKILLQAIAHRPDAPEIQACIYREIGLAAVAEALGVALSDMEPTPAPSLGRNDAILHEHELAA
jgi:hypothetical protein